MRDIDEELKVYENFVLKLLSCLPWQRKYMQFGEIMDKVSLKFGQTASHRYLYLVMQNLSDSGRATWIDGRGWYRLRRNKLFWA